MHVEQLFEPELTWVPVCKKKSQLNSKFNEDIRLIECLAGYRSAVLIF